MAPLQLLLSCLLACTITFKHLRSQCTTDSETWKAFVPWKHSKQEGSQKNTEITEVEVFSFHITVLDI